MRKIIIPTIFVAFSATSCFNDIYKTALRTTDTNSNKYEVKYMLSGCCGCKTLYINTYKEKRLDAQIVSEFVCGFGEPTRFTFQYTPSGEMQIAGRQIAVYDSSYTIPVGSFEKELLRKLDSLVDNQVLPDNKKHYAEITGFRSPKEGERLHPFAFGTKKKTIFYK